MYSIAMSNKIELNLKVHFNVYLAQTHFYL